MSSDAFVGVDDAFGVSEHVTTRVVTPQDGRIIIDNPELLFLGSFERQGNDLLLTHGNEAQLVVDYFGTANPANVEAPNGAYLTAQAVTSLAGDPSAGLLAQSGAGGEPLEIGKVVKLEGTATSTSESGVTNQLEVGSPVYQGDVIETGSDSKLGISFVDETVFSMSADARMILDELIYDPAAVENSSMAFNLVQGAFVFVTGEIAPTGNMNIETPVATMGIRGTTPKVTINTALGVTEFTILPDPGSNEVGNYLIINKATGDIMGSVASASDKWVVTGLSSEAVQIAKSGVDLLEDQVALDEITEIYNVAQSQRAQIDGSNNFASINVDLGVGDGGPQDGDGGVDDVLDGGGVEVEANLDINQPPIAEDDFFALSSGQIIGGINIITGAGGGGVDIDPEGFPLGAILINGVHPVPANIILPSGAILLVAANGGVSYDPNGVYNFLGRGDVDEDIFEYTIEDSGGLTDVGQVTITLTGLNDQPTITNAGTLQTLTEANDTGSATQISATDTISFQDTDASDRHTESVVLATKNWVQNGTPGAAFPNGDVGQISTSAPDNLVLTETAAVDDPVMDRTLLTVNSVPGEVTGTVSWTWTALESEIDFLAGGETLTLTYTITITDDSALNPFAGNHALDNVTQDVQVRITGVNDAPQIATTDSTTLADDTDLDGATSKGAFAAANLSGTIAVTDVDITDTSHTFTVTTVTETPGGGASSHPALDNAGLRGLLDVSGSVAPTATATGGSINWTFTGTEDQFDYLADGESVVLVYTVRVADTSGATDTTTVTVTINGANDGPEILATDSTTLTDDTDLDGAAGKGGFAAANLSGTIAFTDVDITDTSHTFSVLNVVETPAGGASAHPALDNAGLQALLNVGASVAPTNAATGGTIGWAFTGTEDQFDYLADGESVVLVYTVQVADTLGATDTTTVTVTVNGNNDGPEITGAAGSTTLSDDVDNDGAAGKGTFVGETLTGSIAFTDVDITDTGHAFSVTQVVQTPGGGAPVHPTMNTAALQALLDVSTSVAPTDAATGGSINWSFTGTEDQFDYLANGESVVLVYTVQVADTLGATDTTTVTVTVNGSNDGPEITGSADSTTLADDSDLDGAAGKGAFAPANLSGTIAFTDVDITDTNHTFTVTNVMETPAGGASAHPALDNAGLQGLLDVSGSTAPTDTATGGSINWTFTGTEDQFDYLANGESVVLVYTVQVADTAGATDTTTVTVTVNGANDGPEILATASTTLNDDTDLDGAAGKGTFVGQTLSGSIAFTDVDITDTGHSFSVTQVVQTPSGGASDHPTLNIAALQGLLNVGTSVAPTNAATGGSINWSFTGTEDQFDYLADGESLALVYTVQVQDALGATDTTTVTVTVSGGNDGPEITGAAASTILTDDADVGGAAGQGSFAEHTLSGTIAFTDVDITDTGHTFSVLSVTEALGGGAVNHALGNSGLLALLNVTNSVAPTNAATGGTIGWAFTGTEDQFDYLADGQSVVLVYTVQVADTSGATDTTTVTVTVNGTNDAPTVSADASAGFIEAGNATSQNLSETGTVSFDDVDTPDLVDITFALTTSAVWSGGTIDSNLANQLTAGFSTAATGAAAPGSVNWNYNVTGADLQFLAKDETITFTYTVTATDNHGATGTDTVAFTITGTNDNPFIFTDGTNNSVLSGAVTEDNATTTVNGTVDGSDVDNGDTFTFGIVDGASVVTSLTGTYGSLSIDENSGAWTYTLNNADADTNALAGGQSVLDTFNVRVTDQHGLGNPGTINVTVNGANDAPVL
ncbi:MAG: FecR domain-containing protein, partial [Rhizobiaceae bacterium]|nr:FecR domain-containing protein [Rhizobiaceae bacterium]